MQQSLIFHESYVWIYRGFFKNTAKRELTGLVSKDMIERAGVGREVYYVLK